MDDDGTIFDFFAYIYCFQKIAPFNSSHTLFTEVVSFCNLISYLCRKKKTTTKNGNKKLG